MPNSAVIAVDAMSGDRGSEVTTTAAIEALARHPDISIVLTGPEDRLGPFVRDAGNGRLSLVTADEVVAMNESPRDALRKKKDSSMRRALELVRDGAADACVSAGNTGALVATSRFVLKTMAGIDRPAIVSTIPARGGHTCMLDLGANTGCTANRLLQYAIMGSVIAEDLYEIGNPRVGLLNIGEESFKGTDAIREAATLLEESQLNYIGYVEGHDVFSGRVDVVVSDGFTGNVALKTMEGAFREVLSILSEDVPDLGRPVLEALHHRLDPRRYNGASLVGLRGIVIKSHGNADTVAFGNAIDMAVLESEKGVPAQIADRVALLLSAGEAH